MAATPVFQLSKEIPGIGVDYDYLIGLDQAEDAVANGYAIDCVAYIASTTQGPNMLELKRYVQNGFHYFTTNPGPEVSTWTYDPPATKTYVVSSAQPNPGNGALQLAGYSKVLTGNQYGHFFTADLATNPAPAGYTPFTPTNTGWVRSSTCVEFEVAYNGNGDVNGSGVTVTGGNAVGDTVRTQDGDYLMTASDAYMAFGVGNWIAFNKTSSTSTWHISDITEESDANVEFDKVTFDGDQRIAIVDDNEDQGSVDRGYKYALKLFDVTNDVVVTFDPKIVNRGSASSGPVG